MKYDPEDPRITAYVFGELEGEDLTQFESQLADSPELQRAVEQTRETLTALESELVSDAPPALSPSQRNALEAAISAPPAAEQRVVAPAKPEPPSQGRGAGFWATIAIVEAVAIMLGLALFFRNWSEVGQRLPRRCVTLPPRRRKRTWPFPLRRRR